MRVGLAAAVVALGVVLLGAGCGTGDLPTASADQSEGKQLFTQKCAGCHTLADAGTRGVTGPNLDDAFGSARAQGFKESTIRQIVATQMKYPLPPMPDAEELFPKCTSGGKPKGCSEDPDADLDAVAAYVAAKAGAGGPASGGQASGGGASGREIFTTNCGSCHTLGAAGTSGQVGPNLDEAKPSLAKAKKQVENGGGGMPAFKGQLTDAQIAAVAKYVSENAGKK